jgi:hypothetical protein
MVRPVATSPPPDCSLNGAPARDGEEVLEGPGSVICAVGPKAMIT